MIRGILPACLFLLAMLPLAGCGKSKVDNSSKSGAVEDSRKPAAVGEEAKPLLLSEEFSPHIPGRVRQFNSRNYKDARYSGDHRATDLPDGTVKRERSDGTAGTAVDYRRIQDGFIEYGSKTGKDIYWTPDLKLGAKFGDSWTNKKGNVTYTFSESTQQNGTPIVVISLKQFDKGDHYYTVKNWYMKGVGIVRYTQERKVNGKWETEKEITYKEWKE